MCGIIGYIGKKDAYNLLKKGLLTLEYRGYDSCGFAILKKNKIIKIIKDKGYIKDLIDKKIDKELENENIGIAHTRWATHGVPNKINSHPHLSQNKKIAIVHNGIIENYLEIKKKLKEKNIKFKSQTDTEVFANLLSYNQEKLKGVDFETIFLESLKKIRGSFAFLCLEKNQEKIFIAKNKSPLVIGKIKNEYICASDVTALIEHTKKIYFLKDNQYAILEKNKLKIGEILTKKTVIPKWIKINWDKTMAKKQGFEYFTKKEIFEQLQTIDKTIEKNIEKFKKKLFKFKKIHVIGCGSSFYSAKFFEYLSKDFKVEVSSYIASEYDQIAKPDKKTAILAISQSGETADTINAIKFAKQKKANIFCITNVIGSTIYRLSKDHLLLDIGPEIGVVSTKAFTAQLILLLKLFINLKKQKQIIKKILNEDYMAIKKLAKKIIKYKDFFFLGRGIINVISLEAALKLKEITYLHAESYPCGELKHGPLSLLDEKVCVFIIIPKDENFYKNMSTIMECKARNTNVFAISNLKKIDNADYTYHLKSLSFSKEDTLIWSIISIIFFQILSFEMALLLKRNPDKPRNLAKSVTVE